MSAAEVVELIRNLPKKERDEVVALVAREFATPKNGGKTFDEASQEVFSEYPDLLAKLAK